MRRDMSGWTTGAMSARPTTWSGQGRGGAGAGQVHVPALQAACLRQGVVQRKQEAVVHTVAMDRDDRQSGPHGHDVRLGRFDDFVHDG